MDVVPGSLLAAFTGAVIAAIGYVSKLAVDGLINWNARRRERRAKLVALQSVLLASKAVFNIQSSLAKRLCREIANTHKIEGTYDRVLAKGYSLLDERQKLEHGLIRNYTSNCLLPLNLKMMDWLSADSYFKGAGRRGNAKALSGALQRLEAHLILWRAKYDFWIPDKPENAIVYMSDEEGHGISFPKGIENLIARITGGTIEEVAEEAIDQSRYLDDQYRRGGRRF